MSDKQNPVPSLEEFQAWANNPATQWFLNIIAHDLHNLISTTGLGHTVDTDSIDNTALVTAKEAGKAQALWTILNADYKAMIKEVHEPEAGEEDEG